MEKEKEIIRKVGEFLRFLADLIETSPQLILGNDKLANTVECDCSAKSLDLLHILLKEGEAGLKQKLINLKMNELKKIIADHDFDPEKMAVKWRKKEKLINLIMEKLRVKIVKK